MGPLAKAVTYSVNSAIKMEKLSPEYATNSIDYWRLTGLWNVASDLAVFDIEGRKLLKKIEAAHNRNRVVREC